MPISTQGGVLWSPERLDPIHVPMNSMGAMLADLGALPAETKRAILLRLLDEFLAGNEALPPELVAARAPLFPRGRSPGSAMPTAAFPVVANSRILALAVEHAGRSMSLREMIDNVE